MHKKSSAWMAGAALAAALLAGCGGGGEVSSPIAGNTGTGGGGTVTPAPAPTPTPASDISTSISDLFAFVVALINGTSDTTDPININPLTLATDDAAQPTPVN